MVVKFRARIGGQRFQHLDGFLKFFSAGHIGTAFHVGERSVVRRDHSGARAAFDGHIANGHAALHGKRANRLAGILDDVAAAAGDSNFADDGEDDVFCRDALWGVSR